MWQGMGSKRPELLITIERLLWQVILNSARSAGGTVEMLKAAFEQIDGLISLGGGVNIGEIDWFEYSKQQ
jgi:hypothetical protein